MEQYIVSARKYRPATFDTVIGQQALTTTLKNAISTGRLAHAYLFCGSRGVGKTSCARIFAKTINCTNRTAAGEACNECESCRQFNEGRSMNIIELDAASNNGVEDIRDLVDQVNMPPVTGTYRVFIVDEVHMLSQSAFNAFLKTLEEPPSYVVFILATTEKHKIIPTILSRCQIYDFNRITVEDMVAHLEHVAAAEGIKAEREALGVIARKADGAMRDALSIFDQVAASTGGNITYSATVENLNVLDNDYYERLLDAFIEGNVAKALLIYKEIRDRGFDSQFFVTGLAQYLRDVAVAADPATRNLVDGTDEQRQHLAERAAKLHPTFIYRALDLCNSADFNFRQASNKQFLVELTLIKLCQQLSPSSNESGDDGGRLQALSAAQIDDLPASAAPAAAAAPVATSTSAPAAPKAAPAPAPAPAKPAPAAPRQAPSSGYSMGSLSLGAMRRASTPASAPTPAASEAEPVQDKAFTDAGVLDAWRAFVDSRSATDPVERNVLHMTEPIALGQGKYLLRYPSTVQAETARRILPHALEHIRHAVENSSVDIDLEVSDAELPKYLWTDERVQQDIIDQYPAVGKFIVKYQLRRI